jgi:Protein of unknown function (DUF4012)
MTRPASIGRQPRVFASRPKRRRGRVLWALAIVIVIVACSGVGAALEYMSVKSQANQLQAQLTAHLQIGQTELEAAKTSLRHANESHDTGLIDQAKVQFTSAKVNFMLAAQIAGSSQLLHTLEGLPAVGELARSRHTAVDEISAMGVAISDAGLELAALDQQIIKPTSPGGQGGVSLLTVIDQTQKSLVKVRADIELAVKAAAQVDVQLLPTSQQASFSSARGTLSAALVSIDAFQALVPVITEVLGGNGARTYLIEQVNPTELRPGGGFIGTYSVVRADQGTLKLITSGTATQISEPRADVGHAGYVLPPGPLREFVPYTSWSFIDSNFFPDFPSNAQAGEMFAQPKLSSHIDAVIAMDYYTVAKILGVTGPVAVPGFGVTLDANNFVSEVVQLDVNNSPAHKLVLNAVAGPLMTRVSTLPPSSWPALLSALNDMATQRHLQVYFNNDTVQKAINQFGWSGVLNPAGAPDYMIEVEANLGGTKANYFVTRHFTVDLSRSGNTLHHQVTIDLTDNMPFSYRPGEYYSAYLRLYVSGNASSTNDNLRPAKYPNPPPPTGTKMIDGWVPLFHGYGHSARAVFSYDTPWTANGRGEGQIYWQKEPGTTNDAVTVNWNDGSGHSYTVSGDLGQDRVIAFSPRGVSLSAGQPAQAQLPSLSLG